MHVEIKMRRGGLARKVPISLPLETIGTSVLPCVENYSTDSCARREWRQGLKSRLQFGKNLAQLFDRLIRPIQKVCLRLQSDFLQHKCGPVIRLAPAFHVS
jgi:hypothetical protein